MKDQIIIEPAHGIFVARERDKTIRHIVTVHPDWPSEYWHRFDDVLELELTARGRYKFSRALYKPDVSMDYLQFIDERMGDAIILPHPIGINNIDELRQVLNLNIPVIFLSDNVYSAGINAIDARPELAGMLAADHLIRNGYTRLALIISEPLTPGGYRRNGGYIDTLRLHGINAEIIDCNVRRGDASRSRTYDVILNYIRRNGVRFTGCWAMGDYSAFGVVAALNDCGLSVPDDISVIGAFGGLCDSDAASSLTTVTHDLKEVARTVADGFDDFFAGRNFGILTVRPFLLERKSVRNLRGVN